MEKVIVRYKVKPDQVAENEQLVRAVYQQLHQQAPAHFRYATYKLEDGLTFLHVASWEGEGKTPLATLSAFKDFQAGIKDRCKEMPVANTAVEIGSYFG